MRRTALVLSLTLFFSCKKEKETPPVAPAKMEAIVLDLELANAYAVSPGQQSPDSLSKAYRALIFRKHGMSEKEYEAHLDWYFQHPAELDSVYTHVRNKLEEMKES